MPPDLKAGFNKALELQQAGQHRAAIDCYTELIQLFPDNPPLFYNRATILASLYDYSAAIRDYIIVTEMAPDFLPAWKNLGICYAADHQWQNAYKIFLIVKEHDPKDHNGVMQCAHAAAKLGKNNEALAFYEQVLEDGLTTADAYYNAGVIALALQQKNKALFYFQQALQQEPTHVEAAYNYGVLCQTMGQYQVALQAYHNVLQQDPQHFAAHYNAGLIYKEENDFAAAKRHWQTAQVLQPDDLSLLYLLNAVSSSPKQVTTAPPAYIKRLFDEYANHYNQHVLRALQYRLPYLMLQYAEQYYDLAFDKSRWLDLGCGTGLSGQPFKAKVKEIWGIDLSEQMLKKAKEHYHGVLCGQILDILPGFGRQPFDGVIAADVFPYVGELEPYFWHVAELLRDGGWFLFSVEHLNEGCYQLTTAARFSHALNYINTLCERVGFHKCCCQSIELRQQKDGAVLGDVYVLQKK